MLVPRIRSGLTVIGIDIDVEIVVVVEEAHIGAFGGRLPLVGIDLIELGDRLGLLPDRIGEVAIDLGASAASIRVALAVGMYVVKSRVGLAREAEEGVTLLSWPGR